MASLSQLHKKAAWGSIIKKMKRDEELGHSELVCLVLRT